MQCDPSKDYFAVLGLSSQAPPEVVKAAHRALAKKFHPDLHSGEDTEAEKRFQEIQEAYEVLRDEDKLKQYLALRAQIKLQMQQQQAAPARPHIRPRVYLKLDDRWDHLVRRYPELSQHYAKFCFLSHKLGRQYKLIILGNQNPARFKRVAAKLERQFYRRHFSYHRNLQTLARKLAASHRRHAVRMLQTEIKGRRFVSKRSRSEIVWRYESRYLQDEAPVKAANRSSLRTRVQRGTAHRHYPGQQRTTLKSTHNRPIAWLCMGMAVALGALIVVGPLLAPSEISMNQQAQAKVQVQGLGRSNCIITTPLAASAAQLNKNVC
ncbi:DnaJ domain-containing protein [Anderseniella sp. Alg231-50]|uniref:DnaJ domain-containing protein n=1 Tax=Anderseniella sp. Alg231-50 TaxID=1922226 RepID=UPI000D5548FC